MALTIYYSTMVYADNETVADTSDIDFIEFLGNWETADGEWVDPNELEEDDDTDTQTAAEQDPQPVQSAQQQPNPEPAGGGDQ